MARPLRIHIPGRVYHVYSRGNEKDCIFETDGDHRKFLKYLATSLERFSIECLAYCLMWNHYHLLVIPRHHTVSRLMHHLNTSYAVWFNKKHDRVGHLFQGRFGSPIIDDSDYLTTAISYVCLNPVAANRVQRPEHWRWSSYRATAGLCAPPSFLALDRVWEAFNCTDAPTGRERFLSCVAAGDEPEALRKALLFGGETLKQQVRPLLEPHHTSDGFTFAHRFAARPPLDTLFLNADSFAAVLSAAAIAFHRHAYTLREIGDFVGRTESTVSKWIKKARDGVAPGKISA